MSGTELAMRIVLVALATVVAGLGVLASHLDRDGAAIGCCALALGLAMAGTSAWGAVT